MRVEKHLYKRQYQRADGEWTTLYYARFTCWDRVHRTFPLMADTLGEARDELGRLRQLNKGRFDWAAEKRDREQAKVKALTLADWLDKYVALAKDTPSGGTRRAQAAHLKRILGRLTLSEVTKVRILEYKQRRLSEPLVRYGERVEGTKVKGATVNREVSCLIAALNLAADEGLSDGPPRIKKEREVARERTLGSDEYLALLDKSDRWLQRVLIAANETAFDRGVLLALTWDCVQDGLVVVKGGRVKTGARQRVGISPALREVLDELRAEYRRTPNTERRVFTRGGKPIPAATLRHAFDSAVKDAQIGDFQFRDFRHCARTRWAAAGLPFEVAETGIGHKLRGVSGRYVNLSDDDIRQAFQMMFARPAAKVVERAG